MSGINNEYNEQEIAGYVSAGTSMFSDLFRRFGQPPMVVPEADEACRTYYQEILHIKARLEEIDASNRGIDRIVVNADGTLTVYYSDGTTYTSPSLKGADGQDGHDGHDGAPGQDGHDGAPGRDGVDGQNGADGQDGVTPNITVTATVDNTPGDAEVSVVKSGTDANPIFAFNFLHVKGNTGAAGQPGKDGVSPTAYVTQTGQNEVTITVVDANGTTTATLTGEAGAPGHDGKDGQDGEDGVSPVVTVTDITGGHRVTISDTDGTQSFDVMNGTDGTDGTPGQNGVTPDITMTATADALVSADPTVSVTKGGTTANPTFALAFSGLKGEQGAPGQDAEWPSGGSAGDILTKTTDGVTWATPASGGGGASGVIGWGNYGTEIQGRYPRSIKEEYKLSNPITVNSSGTNSAYITGSGSHEYSWTLTGELPTNFEVDTKYTPEMAPGGNGHGYFPSIFGDVTPYLTATITPQDEMTVDNIRVKISSSYEDYSDHSLHFDVNIDFNAHYNGQDSPDNTATVSLQANQGEFALSTTYAYLEVFPEA